MLRKNGISPKNDIHHSCWITRHFRNVRAEWLGPIELKIGADSLQVPIILAYIKAKILKKVVTSDVAYVQQRSRSNLELIVFDQRRIGERLFLCLKADTKN